MQGCNIFNKVIFMICYRYIFYFVLFGINYNFYGMQQTPVKEPQQKDDQQGCMSTTVMDSQDWGSPIPRRRCSHVDLCLSVKDMKIRDQEDLSRSLFFDTSGLKDLSQSSSFDTSGGQDLSRSSSFDTSARTDRSNSLLSDRDEDIIVVQNSVSSVPGQVMENSVSSMHDQVVQKLSAVQKRNDIAIAQIKNSLHRGTSSGVKKAFSCQNQMKYTRRKTKQNMAIEIVHKAASLIVGRSSDSVEQHNKLRNQIFMKGSEFGSIVTSLSKDLASPQLKRFRTIDFEHVKKPVERKKRGMTELAGGHDLSSYAETVFADRQDDEIHAFIDTKGVIGFYPIGVESSYK